MLTLLLVSRFPFLESQNAVLCFSFLIRETLKRVLGRFFPGYPPLTHADGGRATSSPPSRRER